jgi:hypothetical protein
MVEVSAGLSKSEGNRIALYVVDDGFVGVLRPGEGSGKREIVLEGEGERVFEFWKNGIQKGCVCRRDFIEENSLDWGES